MVSALLMLLALGAVVGAEERVMENFRVPEVIEPTHYTVKILTNLADDFAFNGDVWIDIVPKSATNTITLNHKNLGIFENETTVELHTAKEKRDTRMANLRRLSNRDRKKQAEAMARTTGAPPEEKVEDEQISSTAAAAAAPEVSSTTEEVSSSTEAAPAEVSTTTAKPVTEPITEASTTTVKPKQTTEASTTTLKPKTTEAPTTTLKPKTTPKPTTEAPTTTVKPKTTPKPTTEAPTSTVKPKTTTTTTISPQPTTEAAAIEAVSTEATNEEAKIQVVEHDYDSEAQFLKLTLDKQLEPALKYRLHLRFQGFLSDSLTGFYRVAYSKKNRKTSWLAATVFEPMDARTVFPCFDEPEYKATFDVILGHSGEYRALSNMPLKNTQVMEDKPGWQWDSFETTPKMSTYLLAFLISDLESLQESPGSEEKAKNATEFKYWARHDVVYKARYASKVVPKIHKYMEDIFGTPDVLPKYDLVAMPSFISSALENWGLISLSEKGLLYTPGFTAILNKFETTRLLSHEFAHSWFGNSLSPKWWDQIWLSEGLCNFFETKATDHIQPDWDVFSFSAVGSYLRVFSIDALQTTHPLVPNLKSPLDLNDLFDSITYQKGYYLIRMLNFTLGEEAFMEGVRNYVKDNRFGVVEEQNLWKPLTAAGHAKKTLPENMDLNTVMRAWTREAGYPVIHVTRDYNNKTATLTQKRFLRPKNDYELRGKNGSEETRWYIPVTYTTRNESDFSSSNTKFWFTPDQEEIVLEDIADEKDYILFNLHAAGLYRVKYDYDNWALLVDELLGDNYERIPVINRVQILDDLLDFARSGDISYKQALDATSYLRREAHYLPWKAAFSNFEYISRMLRSTDSGKLFKKFMRSLVSERYEELGFEPKKNESFYESMNRKQIVKWACRTGQRQCARKSLALFKEWTQEKKPDEVNPIPSNLRSVVYCTAIEHGGARDWQFLWNRYLSNTVVTDKAAIIAGLGCSRNARTLRKYLDWSLKETSGLKKQDSVAVFKAVSSNDVGYPLAKKFLSERLNEVPKYIGSPSRHLPQMIDALAKKMNQMSDLKDLESVELHNSATLRASPRTVEHALEKVRFNIGWLQTNLAPINDWLKKQTNS